MRGLVVLLAAWVSMQALPSEAQVRRLQFRHLTVEDGLSSAWVQAILKDSVGFLWFGTQDGLNRFDGGRIKVYRHDPADSHSLRSSAVGVLFEDSRKRLWVGSGWGNQGVALYDRELDRFTTFLPNPGGTAGNNVSAIIEDRQGRLWVATNNGVALVEPDRGTIRRFPVVPDGDIGEPEAQVLALHEDREGRLWLGTVAGPWLFDRERGEYRRWPAVEQAPGGLARAEVGDFYEDDDGALWIATLGRGLHRLDLGTGKATRYMPDPSDPESIGHARIRCLFPDGKGNLYIGTENGGVDVLDLRTLRFSHHRPMPEDEASLTSGSIYSLYMDDQGILWIGTFDGGASRVSSNQEFQQLTVRHGGLSDSHVSALMEDHEGNLWIGTNGGGLNRLDRQTGTVTHYQHDPDDPTTIGSDAVWALLEDSRHELWIGGWDGGFGHLDPASGRVRRFRHDPADPTSVVSDHIWRILELRTGELLVVTHAGADLFDRRTGTFTRLGARYPGADDGVTYSAAEDGNGDIWLAGIAPAARIDRATGQITQYPQELRARPRAGVGWTQAVLVDSAGNVWLGSDGGLACLPAGTEEPLRYDTADGLPSDNISSMVEDASGSLWLGTNRGLSKLVDAVRLPAEPTFLNFDAHDGLQGDEFTRNAALRSRDGRLFFGGPRGLTWFDPARIHRNAKVPPVVLTDFKVFNKSALVGVPDSPLDRTITSTSELTLSYRHSMVAFEFAALNFIAPHKNQHAYLLEGFDRAWNEVGTQRTATYTNLPPGTFTLRVRASNNDGVWNDEGVSLKVRVIPPFWKAKWFVGSLGLAIIAAAAGAHRLRMRRRIRDIEARRSREAEIERQYRNQLEALVGQRTRELEQAQAELVRRERLTVLGQLTATVSHELRNPLGTVRNSLYSAREGLKSGQGERVKRALTLADRNARRCDAIITDLLDFTRKRELNTDETPVDEWLGRLLDEQAVPADVTLTRALGFGGSARIDRERLRRAFVNVLTNAFQAVQENGRPDRKVRVGTRRGEGELEIVISDNGPGIPQDLRAQVFEPLFSTKSFGVGLGLPIVKAIMEEHGGGVRIDDGTEPGATVTLWMPLASSRPGEEG